VENQPGGQNAVQRTVELASEYVVPGGSNFIKGDVVQGGLHLILGLVAKAVWGVPGLLIVQADSIVKARTGRNLYEHIGGAIAPAVATVRQPRSDVNTDAL
jgi:hypothetical protein